MATNIEIKARVGDPAGLKSKVEAISDTDGQRIVQEDIFFHSPQGRLKLRILGQGRGQLIYYERPDSAGPKQSDYYISRSRMSSAGPTACAAWSARSVGCIGLAIRASIWTR